MQGDELNSGAIIDKVAKMAYLDKIINFVGVCQVSTNVFYGYGIEMG